MPLLSLGDHAGELTGLATKSASSLGGDTEREADVGRPAAFGGAAHQFVQHPTGAEVLEHEDVLGPLPADRAVAGTIAARAAASVV